MSRLGMETEREEAGAGESIGALAAAFGLTPRTIRYYEDQGLLAPARAGTQRVYGPQDRARLNLICRGKRLGFSIAEIKDFLDLYEAGDGQVEQMRYLVGRGRTRIAALEQQVRDVEETLADLYGLVEAAAGHLRRQGIEEGP